jgi:hypothetical protein
MSRKNLSTVATQAIGAYGLTATHVINATRFGGERVIGLVGTGFATAVARGESVYGKALGGNLIGTQKRVSSLAVKGLHLGTDGAQRAVGVAVDLATKGVGVMADGAARVDAASRLNALDSLNRVVLPAAQLVGQVAERLEEGSSALVKRVAGKPVPAKAVATRKLKTATRQAATTRQKATRSAKRQLDQAVAAPQRAAKAATQRAGKVVARTATQTSNAARRVARKAEATAAAAA